ncbi:MAG TPA: sigma-70 family RNA polymerase sigma factor [Candidatus Ruania gallistercoris]|uniref:Sigma-70 family RNA polymerase sigma factor n=1 Tax=Candidatus Ruania gallistercoris TaxID=2838746 RepID=A0A9D2EJ53_9MICO|nr:sigma-70 family RNA polymerase sigma factor [Candidatus Ruania gallistercoris]
MTGDVALAEDLASEAVLAALKQWPGEGVPRNPGAWLTAVAKRRAIDTWRRDERRQERYAQLAVAQTDSLIGEWEPIEDDVLRLIFIACHPVLSRESQVALTLRIVGGLTTAEIARMLLTSVPTVQARITRAKRTLSEAGVPFETPEPEQWGQRLTGVLSAVYLVFAEGYAATDGAALVRRDLAQEGLRLGRVLAGLVPAEPEAHALVALMELQASHFPARIDADGNAVLLEDQDRRRWDRAQIRRGQAALARADALGRGRGPYGLQAAIAQCHAVAPSVAETDWDRIVVLYEALGRLAPNPVVELNRAVAVAMAGSPEEALTIVEEVAGAKGLQRSHLVPSVRGELLSRLGRTAQARRELLTAADLAGNEQVARTLRAKAAELGE